MTSYPAQIVGIYDRGLIRESMMADLLVLNMETVRDNATDTNPRNLSQGIDYVIVNGSVVVEEGRLNQVFPGRFCGERRKNS